MSLVGYYLFIVPLAPIREREAYCVFCILLHKNHLLSRTNEASCAFETLFYVEH